MKVGKKNFCRKCYSKMDFPLGKLCQLPSHGAWCLGKMLSFSSLLSLKSAFLDRLPLSLIQVRDEFELRLCLLRDERLSEK